MLVVILFNLFAAAVNWGIYAWLALPINLVFGIISSGITIIYAIYAIKEGEL